MVTVGTRKSLAGSIALEDSLLSRTWLSMKVGHKLSVDELVGNCVALFVSIDVEAWPNSTPGA